MKYIILDIEWYENRKAPVSEQTEELLQIGACMLDSDWNIRQRFYQICAPAENKPVDSKCLKLMHLSAGQLRFRASAAEVLKAFHAWLPEEDYIIILWFHHTQKVLHRIYRNLNLKCPFSHVLVLKDLMRQLHTGDAYKKRRKDNFSDYCEAYGIYPDKVRLHVAKHDAVYLAALFHKFMVRLQSFEQKTESSASYSARPGKRLHRDGKCQTDTDPAPLRFTYLYEAIAAGQLPCQRCVQINISEGVLLKGMGYSFNDAPDEQYIEALCAAHGMSCAVRQNLIFIHTGVMKWYLEMDGELVNKIFHENYRRKRIPAHTMSTKFKTDYHDQGVKKTTLPKAVRYIYKHDQWYRRRFKKDARKRAAQVNTPAEYCSS